MCSGSPAAEDGPTDPANIGAVCKDHHRRIRTLSLLEWRLTHFNTKAVANMPILIPSLAEQHRIVARVDALIAEVLDPATTAEMEAAE